MKQAQGEVRGAQAGVQVWEQLHSLCLSSCRGEKDNEKGSLFIVGLV